MHNQWEVSVVYEKGSTVLGSSKTLLGSCRLGIHGPLWHAAPSRAGWSEDEMEVEARSVNGIPRTRAAFTRRSLRLHAGVLRAVARVRRIEFYFHSVKVVAPPVLRWPSSSSSSSSSSPPRAYQTCTVFLILIPFPSPFYHSPLVDLVSIEHFALLEPLVSGLVSFLLSSFPYWFTDRVYTVPGKIPPSRFFFLSFPFPLPFFFKSTRFP